MTAVLSGTNGLLQSYDYQAPTTGFSYTFAAGTQTLILNPAGTLGTGTITMPASPADGMTITFSSSQQITALTMAGNGATISGAVTFMPAKAAVSYMYRATGTTWFPTESVPGNSQIVSGTSVASTSGTSIDFTGIPSWVKRITVMFREVSQTGTDNFLIQLGTASGPITSGYISSCSGGSSPTSTAGFIVAEDTAAEKDIGQLVISMFSTSSWIASGVFTRSGSTAIRNSAGQLTGAGTIDRVRITTGGGTNTFDFGSINILYE